MPLSKQISDPNSKQPAANKIAGHVYLVDDNEDIRHHLEKTLIRFGLTVSCFDSAEQFVKDSTEITPAVVLLDMVLPGANGINVFEKIRDSGWKTPVIFMSGQSEPIEIIDAMKMGAVDFLWKPFSTAALIEAIKKALISVQVQAEISNIEQARFNLWNTMTEREQEVCTLMLNGFGNSQISAELNIQPDTVKKHRARILQKFSVSTLSQLIDIFRGFSPIYNH